MNFTLLRFFTPVVTMNVLVLSLLIDKTRAVISHLAEVYWEPLWGWLLGDRDGNFKTAEVNLF